MGFEFSGRSLEDVLAKAVGEKVRPEKTSAITVETAEQIMDRRYAGTGVVSDDEIDFGDADEGDKKVSFEPGVIDGGLSVQMCRFVESQRIRVVEQLKRDHADKVEKMRTEEVGGDISHLEEELRIDIRSVNDIYAESIKSLPVAAMALENAASKLKELLQQSQEDLGNLDRLLELRDNFNDDGFVDELRKEIGELTTLVTGVISKAEDRGVDYFMSNGRYNEEMAVDLEQLLLKLKKGKGVSELILSIKLKKYSELNVDNDKEVRSLLGDDEIPDLKHHSEQGEHNLELDKIEMLRALVADAGCPIEKLEDRLLRLTKFGFQHRAGALADTGRYVHKTHSGDLWRSVDEEFEDHPEILKTEYLLGTLVSVVRATVNANVMGNSFYLSKEAAQSVRDGASTKTGMTGTEDFF